VINICEAVLQSDSRNITLLLNSINLQHVLETDLPCTVQIQPVCSSNYFEIYNTITFARKHWTPNRSEII